MVGITKQAVHKQQQRQKVLNKEVNNLVAEAETLREEHPGCGVEKMYYTLKPRFIGRDNFIDLFMDLGFRIRRNKNYRRTTYSSSCNYPNLIKGLSVTAPSTVWQSDITYIDIGDKFYYAVFIIDVYTKKIVGYKVSNHMRATANLEALKMALDSHPAPRIHHSDRGSQYIYHEYLKTLKDKGSAISMALSAQDNAYAERINQTIKDEYLKYGRPKTFKELEHYMRKAVDQYNYRQPHNHLKRMTPGSFEKRWYEKGFSITPIEKIFDNTKELTEYA